MFAVGRLREADAVLAKLPTSGTVDKQDGEATLLTAEIALAANDGSKALAVLREPVTSAPAEHLALLPAFVKATLLEKQSELARTTLEIIRTEPTEADDRMALEFARARLAAGMGIRRTPTATMRPP